MMLRYEHLLSVFRKGLRNRNWRRLSRIERAMFIAALSYARIRRIIVSPVIVENLYDMMRKLTETPGLRAFRRGFERAIDMFEKCRLWTDSLKKWLKDPDFIMWLGTQ
ncbi:MAG: hypothetical protein N2V77_01480 [Canidatus Methanoxibalbensis ujae]|nr:hypothetical protein [Candidatus Methanoxibalbensis ujae]